MPDSVPKDQPLLETAQPFRYAPPSGEASRNLVGGASWSGTSGQESVPLHSASDQTLQKAYERGFAEGKASARVDFEKATAEMRSQISTALQTFSKDRADYFGRIESEVVRLSLSIARKILHRESQMDPLVLTGVVHVALEKLNNDTRVRLCTHPDEVRFWNDYIKQSKGSSPLVDVVGDPSLSVGQCTLETEFGTTQISLETQLKEIEQGFFDLLEQRTKVEA
jgi:flagellar assembly protein FliH